MNHTKYRVWLISIALAVAVLGMIWYLSGKEEEKTITDGTLVYHELTGGEQADRKLTVQQLAEGFSYERNPVCKTGKKYPYL